MITGIGFEYNFRSSHGEEPDGTPAHAAGGRDGRQRGGERSYYNLHYKLENFLLVHCILIFTELRIFSFQQRI